MFGTEMELNCRYFLELTSPLAVAGVQLNCSNQVLQGSWTVELPVIRPKVCGLCPGH